ncbi:MULTISPECIES: hypothetical protein [unclassified Bradyrhizobium]|uniref:hypothetical protein n=1 Tax=unclassified Bradyrhizobium TaxID=2631580 RepID=UPI0028E463AB|nr:MULTISPECIES: hypothetical protein [unclassified Bradyrhizobium]
MDEHWTVDQPIYDPSTIDCPVLVLAAEWDVDVRFGMAHDLFVRLVSAPYKRLVEIGQGTHMILMERNRTAGVRRGDRISQRARRAGALIVARTTCTASERMPNPDIRLDIGGMVVLDRREHGHESTGDLDLTRAIEGHAGPLRPIGERADDGHRARRDLDDLAADADALRRRLVCDQRMWRETGRMAPLPAVAFKIRFFGKSCYADLVPCSTGGALRDRHGRGARDAVAATCRSVP